MSFKNAEVWRYTQILKDYHAELLQDFQQYQYTDWITNNQHNIDTIGLWAFVPFISKGVHYKKFIQDCPTVGKLLEAVPVFDNCAFSIMGPGAEIKPHKGYDGDPLRVHLGLQTTGEASITVSGEKMHWQNKQVIIFDDRETHSTDNPSNENRIVFLFDILTADYYNNLIC